MLHLNYGDPRPLYEQIKEKTKELIINGTLRENDRLMSVRELAGELAINPNTIQRAYKELESEGYVYSQKSKGYFVMPIKEIKSGLNEDKFDILKKTASELKYVGVPKEDIIKEIKKIYEEDKI